VHGWFIRISKAIPATILVALLVASVPISISMFIRISYEMFPDLIPSISDVLVWVGVLNLVVAAFFILSEKDLRGFLSLLSLASTGMALVGVGAMNSFGIVGSLFQVFSYGLSVAGIGIVAQYLYDHRKSYDFSEFAGLIKEAPHTGVVTAIFFGCVLGLPSGVGFIGTSLLFIGAFSVHPVLVAVEALLLIVLGGYLFQVYRKMFLAAEKGNAAIFELDMRNRFALFPLAFVILVVGFYPAPLIEIVRLTTGTILGLIQR
jgi:NADH-quinone oxidoreductase subunit M